MHAVLGAAIPILTDPAAGSTFATIVFVIAAAAAVIQEHFHSVFDVVVNHHRVRGVDSRIAAHILVSLYKDEACKVLLANGDHDTTLYTEF